MSKMWGFNKPYRNFFHPYKCFLDKLIHFFFLSSFNNTEGAPWKHLESAPNHAMTKYLSKIRDSTFEKRIIDKLMETQLEDFRFCVVEVKRNHDILKSFCKIDHSEISQHISCGDSSKDSNDTVKLSILCPNHLCKDILESDGKSFNLHAIDPSIPVILNFHGGGFVVSNSMDIYSVTTIADLIKARKEKSKSEKSSEVIFISIDYRLAPEHVFPAGVIDCFSVVDYLFSSLCSPPDRKFHISGASAGGNFATTVTMECLRTKRDRIKSVLIDFPFLDPEAGSDSYYMNSRSSIVPYLLWCWRAYLGLKSINEEIDTESITNKEHIKDCEWMKQDEYRRLINPSFSIPKNNLGDDVSPKFVVTTGMADPLHDEGVELVKQLNLKGYKCVEHFEACSDHATHRICDNTTYQKALHTYCSFIWDDE